VGEERANPGNGHLLFAVPLLLGWDRVACLVQLAFVPLGMWAVRSLARAAGASQAAGWLAALCFASAPLVFEQAAVPMLDLATAALSLTAAACLLSVAERPSPPARETLWLAGLSMGLALGTKTSAWAHFPLVVAVIFTSRWCWSVPAGPGLRALLDFALPMAIPTAFWYTRSSLLFGNPIHPIGISLLGFPLVPGTDAEEISGQWEFASLGLRSHSDWLAFAFRDPRYDCESGLGPLRPPLPSPPGPPSLSTAGSSARLGRARRPFRSPVCLRRSTTCPRP
jgi:hypothetical protein